MELLILILIILVVMAFSLSCISFWMTIKMVREISRLEENVKNSTDKINILHNALLEYATKKIGIDIEIEKT